MAFALLLVGCGGAVSAVDIGSGCRSSSDCSGGASCAPESDNFPYGLCTVGCHRDGDCPGGDVCVSDGNSSEGVCAPSCDASEGCQSGYICTEIGGFSSGSHFVCNGSALA